MTLVDGTGLPLSLFTSSPSRYEGHLVEPTLERAFGKEKVQRIIGDKGYDDDKVRASMAEQGIDFIAPNKRNRKHKTQDLRKLRRYNRRWIVERTFAWLHNYRRVVTRWERHVEMYVSFLHVAWILLIVNRVLK